jgi:uncharacterized metal-binding protein YceD (DUF177 family)
MTAPEFSRPVAIDKIGETARTVTIEAEEAERAALARRFALDRIDRLQATARIVLRGGIAFAEGRVDADVVQRCVITDDPLPTAVAEHFDIRFLPVGTLSDNADEVELQADEVDTVFYEGGAIDLGEAAAETMALALDPFPRSPRADEALRDAGVLSEGEAGPFGALKDLKERLEGKR